MGCRYSFVVDLVEEIVGEGGSRSSWQIHEHDSSQPVSQQNVAIRVFWSRCQPRLTLIARDFRHGKQRVSPLCHVLFHLPHWSSCCHERHVFGMLLARDLCHGKQRVSPFYHVSQLLHEKNVIRSPETGMLLLLLFEGKQRVSPFYRDLG